MLMFPVFFRAVVYLTMETAIIKEKFKLAPAMQIIICQIEHSEHQFVGLRVFLFTLISINGLWTKRSRLIMHEMYLHYDNVWGIILQIWDAERVT